MCATHSMSTSKQQIKRARKFDDLNLPWMKNRPAHAGFFFALNEIRAVQKILSC